MNANNLKWNSEYNIGNSLIDKEHQNLFFIARKALNISSLNNSDNKQNELKKLITELTKYVRTHFQSEEIYMKGIKYPDLEKHKKLHENMFSILIELIKELNTLSVEEINSKLSVFIDEYFIKHIIIEDKRIQLWNTPFNDLKKTFGWKSIYSVDNIHIDKEHKQLFDIAQEAFKEVGSLHRKEKIRNIITELYKYIKIHFAHEEEFMLNIKYPKIEQHKNLHKNLIIAVHDLIKQLSTLNIMLFEKELAKIIDIVLVQHIIQEDRKIITWYKNEKK